MKNKVYSVLQTLSINAIALAALILIGIFAYSFVPADRPANLRDQYLRVVNISSSQILIQHDSTIIIKAPYTATVSWTLKCGEDEQFDMGHKIQTREIGVYRQKNTLVIPATAFDKECYYSTRFDWRPQYKFWAQTRYNGVIYMRVTKTGELFYRIDLPKN